jgi:hypothetical protein
MPRPDNQSDFEFLFRGGFFGSAPKLVADEMVYTIRAGNNVWLRPLGRIATANGVSQVSATNVGARLFSANTQRASIAGALVAGRMPYAGFLRYQNAVLFYLSELPSQQVYLDEVAVSGLTTSATAGRLRLGIPAGGGTYNVFEGGFDPPSLPAINVSTPSGGTKAMSGQTGVALCAWRTSTNAISAPSNLVYKAMTPSTADIFNVVLPSAVSGQDGWILAGTRWGDLTAEVRIARYVYLTPRGTFTATNGLATLTGDANCRWLQDLRPGDVVTINATSYTILTVTANDAATLTTNFAGSTGSGKTATVTTVAADWYNGELSDLLDRDVFKPPVAAGVFQFANRVFLWGTYGESGSVTGPALTPMLETNPEHVGRFNILTQSGADLLNVLIADNRLYMLTRLGLESVTWTGQSDLPYLSRILAEPGFSSPLAGVVYQDRFYGYNERPLRTVAEDNIDVEFASPVWEQMRNWTSSRVVLGVDPKNQAVLYCHYDGSSTTEIYPFMTQLGQWGPSITVSGQVTDTTVVNGKLYLIILSGGNYRVNEWEGGLGASSPWVASQFVDLGSLSYRKRLKNLHVAGQVSTVKAYLLKPGGAFPDITNAGAADATFTLSGSERDEAAIWTNLEGAGVALRFDLPPGGSFFKAVASGYQKGERR